MAKYEIQLNGIKYKEGFIDNNISSVKIEHISTDSSYVYINIHEAEIDVSYKDGNIVKLVVFNGNIYETDYGDISKTFEDEEDLIINLILYSKNIPLTEHKTRIAFFKNIAERNKVEKTIENGSLTEQKDFWGVFRNNISVISPIITVQIDGGLFVHNYAYCNGRYYFVDDIIYVNKYMVEIHLVVDVLNTYRDDIYSLYGFVDRNETYFNDKIQDVKRRISLNKNIDITRLDIVNEVKPPSGNPYEVELFSGGAYFITGIGITYEPPNIN